ncbi:TIR domain-containing protein [filamentous cyanobacterium LEGE 11480]|uniref:TIR domain-containing protein n=1 Tax=Romeriopsis navalis LEGE 11480 TaxID=2777977 RepID=A0A928VQU7_9CYAN|nr:TIR domain-containing protein [Romeriopsis navalis]MBE9032991.1 TIR domain-containing protein [Romeriopsis navalis LEGE 11480]
MEATSQYDIFISYSRRDKAFVQRLHDALKHSGQIAWIDWFDIPAGSEWWDEITEGIEGANVFLFVISPDSLASKYCADEIMHARKYNKRLLPIVYRDCDEDFDENHWAHQLLRSHHWLYFRESDDFEQAFPKLLKSIKTDLEHTKTHTRLLRLAIEWERRDRDESLLLWGKNLEEIEQWLQAGIRKEPRASELQWEYVGASRKSEIDEQQAEQHRQQKVIVWLLALMVVAVVAAIFAWHQRGTANKQREIAELREQAANVLNLLSTPDTTKALILAIDATKRSEQHKEVTSTVESSLLRALQQAKEITIFANSEDTSSAIAFSPDGKLVLLGDEDGKVKLQDLQSGQHKHPLEAFQDAVSSVTFSDDGKSILAVTQNGTAKVWNVKSGKQKRPQLQLGPVQKDITQVSQDKIDRAIFSPDAQKILTVSANGQAKLWNSSGRSLANLENQNGAIRHAAFSPDGKFVLTACSDNTVKLWDLTGERLKQFDGHTGEVRSVAFSRDGKSVITAASDNTVRIWEVDSTNLRSTIQLKAEPLSVAFSPDGKRILAGAADGKIQLWTLQGEPIELLKGHLGAIQSVAFSRDGQQVISSSDDGTVRVWDVQGQDQLKIPPALPNPDSGVAGVSLMALSCQGKWIARLSETGEVQLWDRQGKPLKRANLDLRSKHADRQITNFAINCNGKRIVTGDEKGNLQLWNLSKQKSVGIPLAAHALPVTALAFSRDGKQVASGSRDHTIRLWNAWSWESGEPIGQVSRIAAPMQGHKGEILSVGFSANGTQIVSAASDGTLRFWNNQGQRQGKLIKGYVNWFRSVAFKPDASRVITGGNNGLIRLWSSKTGEFMATALTRHAAKVPAVAFDQDQQIVSLGSDGSMFQDQASPDDLVRKGCYRLRAHPLLLAPRSISPESDDAFMAAAGRVKDTCDRLLRK